GLSADGGLIERPDRLVIVLVGAGLTGIGGYWDIEWLTYAVHVSMWVLAVLSIVTVFQRVLAVRNSPGAREVIPPAAKAASGARRWARRGRTSAATDPGGTGRHEGTPDESR